MLLSFGFVLDTQNKSALPTKLPLCSEELLLFPPMEKKLIKGNLGFKCDVFLTLPWNVSCDIRGENSSFYALCSFCALDRQTSPGQCESTFVVSQTQWTELLWPEISVHCLHWRLYCIFYCLLLGPPETSILLFCLKYFKLFFALIFFPIIFLKY